LRRSDLLWIITFSPETQSEALADDRELSIHLDFPLSADKPLFISQARYVAHRLAAISFTLPSPEHARQFVQGIREGRVRLASHSKGLKPAQPTADRRTASLSMTKTHSFQVNLGSASGG
jgi:hypothetical protein